MPAKPVLPVAGEYLHSRASKLSSFTHRPQTGSWRGQLTASSGASGFVISKGGGESTPEHCGISAACIDTPRRARRHFNWRLRRSEARRARGGASSRGPWDHPRLHRQQALALQFLARELAGAADGFRLLCPRRTFCGRPQNHVTALDRNRRTRDAQPPAGSDLGGLNDRGSTH